MFAKRVSEHLMEQSEVTPESSETEALRILKLYFERIGKFSCEEDVKKLDQILHAR